MHLLWLQFVLLLGILDQSVGRSLKSDGRDQQNEMKSLWKPLDGRTHEDWLKCRGLPCEDWERTEGMMTELQQKLQKGGTGNVEGAFFVEENSGADLVAEVEEAIMNHGATWSHDLMDVIDEENEDLNELADQRDVEADILLTPEQAAEMLKMADEEDSSRVRRAINSETSKRWPLPIFYKFDGDHDEDEMTLIRQAVSHWEEHTCLRFFEVNKDAVIKQNHLLFTRALKACASFVGKIDLPEGNPQMINLGEACFKQLGTAVHEIGHALGLWHQHQRPSRDESITVHNDEIASWARSNFVKVPMENVNEYNLPYDYNSIMHYSGIVGTKDGKYTITTHDPLFQNNLGQRYQLSFLDAKIINLAYCQDECPPNQLKQPCQHGGYQNPNDCSSCICPDGLSGKYCDGVEKSNQDCGGEMEIFPGDSVTVTSPGYMNRKPYPDFTECNWVFKTVAGQSLRLEFENDFGVYQSAGMDEMCRHWVEIQTSKDFTENGPRLCGYRRPENVFYSDGNEVLVTMRAPETSFRNNKGFKLRVTCDSQDLIGQESTLSNGNYVKVTPTPSPSNGHSSDEVKVDWGLWTRCSKQCQCGGCATRSRFRLCNGVRCEGELAGEETEPCNRLCHGGDKELIFVGKFQQRTCSECCQGYKKQGDICVPM